MRKILLSLLSLALLGLPSLRAETHKATLYMDNTGPLSIEVDGLRYFEQNNTQSGPGYGYPIFSDAANESNFLGGFSYGLTNKLVCYGEPVPGRKITVRARYNSRETFDSETGRLADAALVLMITPVRIAYARNKGENWAHAIEKKIVFKESGLRPSGETFVLEATLPYDDSMNGAIISVRAAGNTKMEFGTITVNVVGEFKETTTVTTEASENPGEEEEGSDIPWVYIVPGAIVGGWLVSKIGKKKPKKPKTPKTKKPKEQKKKEPSSFRMILWKNCGDTLYFGDPPVQVGARIEEITPDGQRIERPDLTAAIRISGKENALVEKLRMEGKYRKADVTPTATITQEMPETATVSFVFEGEQGRFVNNLVFKVEGESGILVDAGISFAAGQGKTLEMGFALLGALKNAERIQIKLSDGAQEHFSAQLEQSGETPFIFNIKLTEYGDADQMAGTTEKYYCTIEAYPPGKEEPVKETFDIYRIHLGLRLEVRALKGYLVELESTPDHDIIPPKDSKRRKKYAESRVDWQLVVVDEQQDGQIRSVYPDAPPVFTFEDDYEESMLFTARDDSNYIPLGGELVTYEGRFYRDYTGESIPSLVNALKFEYTSIGHMPDGGFWGIIRATEGYITSPNRSHVKVKVSMTWHGQTFTQEVRVALISQPFRTLNDIPAGMDVNVALKKWDTEDENRQENLREIQRNICWDARFQELRPMFYKVTVMLEGFGKAFGYDEEDYKNVMDNPTATPDEVLKATLALQGNKTAQNILRNQPSDLLRANFNAQMQQLYNDIDPIVIKELQNKMQMYYPSYRNKPPEVRVFKGATGNAGDELRLGRKIGADRDVTYQFKASDGKWYDINEDLAGDTYAEVFNKIQYKFVPKDYEQMMKTLKKADQAVVHGRMGAESYGDDLYKIIDPTKQTEKLGDPERIAKTFIHKCEEWIGQGKAAKENALLLKEAGHTELALSTYGYGDALIEEGVRQGVKQFKRILVPRIEAAALKGAKLDYTQLMAKIRVLESIASPPLIWAPVSWNSWKRSSCS